MGIFRREARVSLSVYLQEFDTVYTVHFFTVQFRHPSSTVKPHCTVKLKSSRLLVRGGNMDIDHVGR